MWLRDRVQLLLFAGLVDFFFCLIVSSFYRPSIVPIHKAVVQLRHVLKKCGCTPLQRQLGEHFNASFVCLRQQRFTSTGVAELRPLLSTVPAELERSRHCPFLLSSLFFVFIYSERVCLCRQFEPAWDLARERYCFRRTMYSITSRAQSIACTAAVSTLRSCNVCSTAGHLRHRRTNTYRRILSSLVLLLRCLPLQKKKKIPCLLSL